ncbi:prepilin-type N-terminal cleavage/methylation domain-containing protein [Sulfurimonas sp. SAG-AH-194-I05]|nr:prepilin-type N-terminal cleavage/methylation domain-containing protein [Sulfurimonas sp. SAG-AH-194-I05]MDF1874296.1 prepilin-type N-terminal cleavage/methylation domain-containing protein [Sulfurimonas sp. SAG-AH-194-I05]
MQKSHYAFTMIELVFVIVVLGILASVAIPKLAATRTDAEITKGRSDIASIRSGIVTERQARLITGDSNYISGIKLNENGLFGGVLMYGVADSTKAGHWTSTNTDTNATATYNFNVAGTNVGFTYTQSTGLFVCTTSSDTFCSDLTN